MSTIFVPTNDPNEWRKRLKQPERQWKPGYSAYETARTWLAASGFPPSFDQLRAFGEPFASLTPLITIPEHTVALPGGANSPTQADVWVLASHEAGLASVAVEAKCEEGFGEPVSEWLVDASPGKTTRIDYVTRLLGLSRANVLLTRYQLLHRAAGAVIEAGRFRANVAVIAVQSFSTAATGFGDFDRFVRLFVPNTPAAANTPLLLGTRNGIALYAVWVQG